MRRVGDREIMRKKVDLARMGIVRNTKREIKTLSKGVESESKSQSVEAIREGL